MKKIIPLILILFVFFIQFKAVSFLHLLPAAQLSKTQDFSIHWHKDWEIAAAQAQKKQKHLFLYFEKTLSPWCAKMEKEILDDRGFIQEMKDQFIFLRLDAAKAEKEFCFFRSNDVPRVIVFDFQKEKMVHMGYLPLTGKKYAEEIKRGLLNDSDGLQKEIKKQIPQPFAVKSFEKKQKIFPLFHADRSSFLLMEAYAELLQEQEKDSPLVITKRKEIEDLDPQNHLKLHLQLAFLEFYANANSIASEAAISPLLEYIDLFGKKDKEHLWQIEMTMAQFLAQKGEHKKALHYARAAYCSAPAVIKKELAQTVEYLKQQSLTKGFPGRDVE